MDHEKLVLPLRDELNLTERDATDELQVEWAMDKALYADYVNVMGNKKYGLGALVGYLIKKLRRIKDGP